MEKEPIEPFDYELAKAKITRTISNWQILIW